MTGNFPGTDAALSPAPALGSPAARSAASPDWLLLELLHFQSLKVKCSRTLPEEELLRRAQGKSPQPLREG